MPDTGTRCGDNVTGSAFAPVLPAHASISARGELVVAGCAVTDLRREYGTPLYVFDEKGIRDQAQEYRSVLTGLWPNSAVLFASKAFPCVAMYRLAAEEGLKVDVAGGGELYLALCAGVEPEDIYLHGNAKTDAELAMAVDAGVGTIIVDNDHDIDRLERLVDREQRVLLRVIPDVSPDTHASQSTGDVRPRDLSGGQRQRIAIARALAVQPDVIVADEAVSALDVSAQAKVVNLLSNLRERLGLTLVFISHDLGVVRALCDRVVVMYLGRVVEDAPTERLFESPQHPYTRALLAAAPDIATAHRNSAAHAPALEGEPASALSVGVGCRFRPRCAVALPVCADEDPPLLGTRSHRAACVRVDASNRKVGNG